MVSHHPPVIEGCGFRMILAEDLEDAAEKAGYGCYCEAGAGYQG
jgi:hypothetical protein